MRAGPAIFAILAAAEVMAAACSDVTRPVVGGAYVDGLKHGPWSIAHPDGSVEEGCYVAGRLHGKWALRDPTSRIVARDRWCHGRAAGSQRVSGEDGSCGVARLASVGVGQRHERARQPSTAAIREPGSGTPRHAYRDGPLTSPRRIPDRPAERPAGDPTVAVRRKRTRDSYLHDSCLPACKP